MLVLINVVQYREISVAEALNCQIEVQKTLQEKLEVWLSHRVLVVAPRKSTISLHSARSFSNFLFDISSWSFLQQVQKKLQMRIEAQGKYLQAILEKAQKSLSQNLNDDSNGKLKATRAHLTGFNSAVYSLMENLNAEDRKPSITDLKGINMKENGPAMHIQREGQTQETKDVKHHLQGDSTHFDLNTKGTYDFVSANGSELELKMLSYRR
jgi:hypothetical protein